MFCQAVSYKEKERQDCSTLQYVCVLIIRVMMYYCVMYYMHTLQLMANRLTTSACLRPDDGHGTPCFHKVEEVGPS